MDPTPLILTVPSGYAYERNNPTLWTLQLITPLSVLRDIEPNDPGWRYAHTVLSNVWVVNRHFGTPKSCFQVSITGAVRTFKRRPEIQIPWRYGAPRSRQVAYGHFISLDGETWDTSGYNYAPYTPISSYKPTRKERQ